jgi:hypothetical protein
MLSANSYDRHVGARLLDFFGATTPWHRRLWSTGLVLTLKEILEASEAVRAGVLTDSSLNYLIDSAKAVAGKDCGVGSKLQMKLIQDALRPNLRYEGIEYRKIRQIIDDLNDHYLERWATTLGSQASPHPSPERTARAIASHMLDAGFDSDYLHRWWNYRIHRDPNMRPLPELVQEAHQLCSQPVKEFEVIVAFEDTPASPTGTMDGWLSAPELSGRLRREGFKVSGLRQNGGLSLKVQARESRSAVEAAAELVDRFIARVLIGMQQGRRLKPSRNAWVVGEKDPLPLRRRGRSVEVHALERENKLYPEGRASRVDAAIELLASMTESSPGVAVACGWAAIEAMLSTPGDDRVLAGDRMAVLVACSFPRAELTALSYKIEQTAGPIATDLAKCGSNLERSRVIAMAIRAATVPALADESDVAALDRMKVALSEPDEYLRDVRSYIEIALRRIYRHRNLVMHWGRTDAVALRASLRTSAPLIGEGMDRIAHAWLVEAILPLELAARASIRLTLVNSSGGRELVDLLG